MRQALIVWGGWPGHQPEHCATTVAAMLESEGFTVEVDAYGDGSNNVFERTDLSRLALIVPVITQSTISKDAVTKLTGAVQGGVGLAGFHGGLCDAFRDSVAYQFMTGGQWVAHPGNVIDYRVNITQPEDPVMHGLSDFDYRSEQYYMHVDPANQVLATTTFSGEHASWTKGVTMPVVWKRQHGVGRVFYSALGHVASEFDHPQMRAILQRGMVWAARC